MAYKRSIFLIDRKFQLRFTLYVCSWLFGFSLVYPVIIQEMFDLVIKHAALDPMGPGIPALQQKRQELAWFLFGLQGLFLATTFAITLFISHRIAGPLYKMKKFFREVAGGNLREELRFRKSDHFKDLAEDYNGMIQGIRRIVAKNMLASEAAVHRIERAMKHTDAAGRVDLEEALAALREVGERASLGDRGFEDRLPRMSQ